ASSPGSRTRRGSECPRVPCRRSEAQPVPGHERAASRGLSGYSSPKAVQKMPARPELLTEVSPQRVRSPRGGPILGEQCQKAPRHPPLFSRLGLKRKPSEELEEL